MVAHSEWGICGMGSVLENIPARKMKHSGLGVQERVQGRVQGRAQDCTEFLLEDLPVDMLHCKKVILHQH